jgi:hypothetical protein
MTMAGVTLLRVGLVGCGKLKEEHPCRAKEMYRGVLFRYASAYCERNYDKWYILSAKYGLLEPDCLIEPYDMTLVGMGNVERLAWQKKVVNLLDMRHEYYLHAGKNYWLPGINLRTPMKGLGIGEQLAWYKKKISKKLL